MVFAVINGNFVNPKRSMKFFKKNIWFQNFLENPFSKSSILGSIFEDTKSNLVKYDVVFRDNYKNSYHRYIGEHNFSKTNNYCEISTYTAALKSEKSAI